MQKILTFWILMLFFTQPLFVYADDMVYDRGTRAKIMEQFKKEQFQNIYNTNNVFLKEENINFFETDQKIQNLYQIQQKNEELKISLVQEKSVTDRRVYNLEATLEALDEQIEENTTQMNILTAQILQLNKEVEELRGEITALQAEIDTNRTILVDYLAHIFKKIDINSNNNDIDTLKTILLNSKDLSEILSDIHYSSILEITWHALVEKHKALVKELFFKRIELQNAITKTSLAKKEELIKRKSILEKKELREKLLEFTKGKQAEFQEYIENKTRLDRELKIKILQNKMVLRGQKQSLLDTYNCEYINLDTYGTPKDWYVLESQQIEMNCLTLNKILDVEMKLQTFAAWVANPFLWPINPERGISAHFRDTEYEKVVGTTHDAIDIRTPQWTDIIAPADGYVTFMRAPIDEWYAYVVLKHAGGFVSVYGHVSEILVQPYQFIKAGEVFARSGWELGTYGAGLMTTGPHLHFEIFKDKEYVDPLDYLDLTFLEEENIPKAQKYVYKYMQDYSQKYDKTYDGVLADTVKIFTLEWDTEKERQRYLLNTYAIPEFRNWDMWVEESIAAKIDPSFLMCIGLSETGLGRNLKTPYNVWNIGNTDSWATWDFENARQWVYWMWRTLNNRFLWEYKQMSKLSRYGNKTWAIYASSPLNWQNNMVRCLTALKDTYIPDNYEFRISESK